MKLYIQSTSQNQYYDTDSWYGRGLIEHSGKVYLAGNHKFDKLTKFSERRFHNNKSRSEIDQSEPRFFEMLQQPEFFSGKELSSPVFFSRFPEAQ